MIPIPISPAKIPPPLQFQNTTQNAELFDAAKKLEASFLAEMLKSAGLGAQGGSFGGGIGEEQFTSFLREAQAEAMVDAGGIGLAESLFQAMRARLDE